MQKKNLPLKITKKDITVHRQYCVLFCKELGMEEEQAYKLAEGFGLGMGSMDTCGALTGLFMLIGMKNSGGTVNAGLTKADTYKKVRDYADKFREKLALYIVVS